MGMRYKVIKENGLYWIQCECCRQIDYMSYRDKKTASRRCRIFIRESMPIFDRRTGVTATHR